MGRTRASYQGNFLFMWSQINSKTKSSGLFFNSLSGRNSALCIHSTRFNLYTLVNRKRRFSSNYRGCHGYTSFWFNSSVRAVWSFQGCHEFRDVISNNCRRSITRSGPSFLLGQNRQDTSKRLMWNVIWASFWDHRHSGADMCKQEE